MKAFLLAAGHGTRLRPLTDRIPKCLVPVAGKPMLEIWFENCRRAGIDEILINLNVHADQVREYVSQHAGELKVTLFEEAELLGSAGTLHANRHWLGDDSAFWVLYGDVLTNLDFPAMLAFHQRSLMPATLGVYRVDNPSRCGIVTVDPDNLITAFVEKPKDPPGELAFAGIMVASPTICDAISRDKSVPDIGTDLLPRIIGRMKAYVIRQYLIDVGTHDTYQRAQTEWAAIQSQYGSRASLRDREQYAGSQDITW